MCLVLCPNEWFLLKYISTYSAFVYDRVTLLLAFDFHTMSAPQKYRIQPKTLLLGFCSALKSLSDTPLSSALPSLSCISSILTDGPIALGLISNANYFVVMMYLMHLSSNFQCPIVAPSATFDRSLNELAMSNHECLTK
jgi:hypothetical protein